MKTKKETKQRKQERELNSKIVDCQEVNGIYEEIMDEENIVDELAFSELEDEEC
jgi:aspartokinase-like uncharacterized kinase